MPKLKETPDVYNIESGYSFADSLVKGLLERTSGDSLALANYTLLLSSRRACRILQESFLRHSKGNSILLPRMCPIGDVNADELSLIIGGQDGVTLDLDIPPAISKLERQLLLAQLIKKSGRVDNFDQAVSLAFDLGSFLDEIQTERLSFENLEKIVPDEFAEHWQETLDFLNILTEFWPEILKERGFIDIAERRNLLIEAQIKSWKENPTEKHIIAAGSIGPIPAVAEMLALISRLPNGELIIPGLDNNIDDDSWGKIGNDHPQFFIKKLLKKIDIPRQEVKLWKVYGTEEINSQRVKLLSQLMRPAETTNKWRELSIKDISEHALAGLTKVNCSSPQEEADVIAFIMREALETPEKTCALITSDRRLARRVSQSLKRWDIKIDDSGGQPLTEFPIGSYLMLVAEMAKSNLAPVTLLAFLKHPLLAVNMDPNNLRDMVQFLDEYVLRGARHSGGFEGLRAAASRIDKKDLFEWLDNLENQTKEFIELMSSSEEKDFEKLLTDHIKLSETLANTINVKGEERLWRGEAGEAAANFLKSLVHLAKDIPKILPEHYISILGGLLKTNTIRPRYGTHPRLSILGQIEARLHSADMVILGGLNEGTWPKLPNQDPWMSRPMRKRFGLPAPEKDISLSAHDFVQAAAVGEVVITRSKKQDGTPTVPSRWLLRMETVWRCIEKSLKETGFNIIEMQGDKYINYIRLMDKPDEIKSINRPMPCPPVNSRPNKLSVTRIESWMRDPYQIYAKYILKLKALSKIDEEAGGAQRGTFIHAALEKFIKEFKDELPKDGEEKLLEFGEEALLETGVSQEIAAFWRPRFKRIVKDFIKQESNRRGSAKPFLMETEGSVNININGKDFIITGKADRIDRLNNGSYSIIDYKSGYVPSNSEVKAGLSPQLPLEAMILEKGGFDKIDNATVEELIYWKLTGGGQEPVKIQRVQPKKYSIEEMIIDAEQGLKKLVEHFDNENTPYLSYPIAKAKPKFSDYEHLSRIKEWGILGDDDSDDGNNAEGED